VADPDHDGTRIFTSPVVVGQHVVFGTTADGDDGYRGYVAAADINNGNPEWVFETDVNTPGGDPLNDGCGGVWSSPTVDEVNHLVITSVSDCHNRPDPPYNERVIALHEGGPQEDGTLAWTYTPARVNEPGGDAPCDWDFGATANLGIDNATGDRFLGIGGKDGYYYMLDPATGAERHRTNVVFGGIAGGFIGSTAFDGDRAYGATSLGDFPGSVVAGQPGNCAGVDLRDNGIQEMSMHAFNTDGTVAWEMPLAQSFGATTVSNGLVYSAATFLQQIQIREASTGLLVKVLPAPSGSASGITISGSSLYYGTGVFLPGPVVDGVYAWATAI
jgi:hypothetical protein